MHLGNAPADSSFVSLLQLIEARFQPLKCAVFLCGSAVTGSLASIGDIDVIVATDGDWMQKIKERWEGKPLDMQIAPATYYEEQIAQPSIGLVRMLATGTILRDDTGAGSKLKEFAENVFSRGLAPAPFATLYERQRAAALIERARRFSGLNRTISAVLLAESIQLSMALSERRPGAWPRAFHASASDLENLTAASKIFKTLDLSNIDDAIDKATALLEAATDESFESSYLGSTPRMKLPRTRQG